MRMTLGKLAAEIRNTGQISTAGMIPAVDLTTCMVASKVDEAMASTRPSEQRGATTIQSDHGQVLQQAPNTVDCLQSVWIAKK